MGFLFSDLNKNVIVAVVANSVSLQPVVDTLPHVSDVYLGCQLLLLLISIYILWL
jgi:hypothetical protein